MDLCKVCLEDIKPFVRLIDRKDLITEADLDDEPDSDELDTRGFDDDVEDLAQFLQYSNDNSNDF